jgi:thioesterase domain-containing protein
MPERFLGDLQQTLDREIPLCRLMGMRVHALNEAGLTLSMPLEGNHNHQRTAFAGSLNALCTITGWGRLYCLVRQHGVGSDSVVVRRSSIRYVKPVESPLVLATCLPVGAKEQAYFLEMLQEKGMAKLDLEVRIPGEDGPAVVFSGSYVAAP